MTTTLRVTGPDPRIARTVKSWQWAEERARRVAQLTGSAEIQTRGEDGAWRTVESYSSAGGRVIRTGEGLR
jgi:hypothetical protein